MARKPKRVRKREDGRVQGSKGPRGPGSQGNAPASALGPLDPGPLLQTVPLAVPLAPLDETVCIIGHVEAQLSRTQRRTLRRIFDGLDQSGSRLANGRRVGSAADAVRWMIEQVGEGEKVGTCEGGNVGT